MNENQTGSSSLDNYIRENGNNTDTTSETTTTTSTEQSSTQDSSNNTGGSSLDNYLRENSNSDSTNNTSTTEPNTASNITITNGSSPDTTTATISNTPVTAANSRTTAASKMTLAEDGTMSIDGKVANNEQLQSYFDYTTYSDKTAATMVEGIFKSDTVTINGVTYNAILNENGEMVSIDGTKRLTQEEIKSYLGEKGFEALVCKTTKDVTFDENGKLTIKDRAEPVKIKITPTEPDINKANNASNKSTSNKSKKSNSSQSRIKSPTGGSTGGGGGGRSGGGGSSGGGGYSGGGSSGGGGSSSGGGNSSGGGKSSNPNPEEVESQATPVIMVDFGGLGSIRDGLNSLKGQLSEVTNDYGSTVNGLASNGDAWSGVDKDAYINQKKGYATNISDVSATLDQFVGYLDTCLTNYEQLESKLAAKEIS